MENTTVRVKILDNRAKIPYFGSKYAAGADLYAVCDMPVFIPPHETVKIDTGIAIELPEGTFGAIYPRSGLATKQGLRPANCVGE